MRGAHQARYLNATTQYFAWLFDEGARGGPYPGESDQVVYAETIFGDQKARDVLATVVLDAHASEAFFGDGLQKHRSIHAAP